MTDERFELLKEHPAVAGLSDEAILEIAQAAETIQCEAGSCLHHAGDVLCSVYLIVHGRLRLRVLDSHGRVLLQRYRKSGEQFGGLTAALREPAAIECHVEDPSTLLKIDDETSVQLSRKHCQFRANFSPLIAASVKDTVFPDKQPVPPKFVAFFHESDDTRIVTHQLLPRLHELGETPALWRRWSPPLPKTAPTPPCPRCTRRRPSRRSCAVIWCRVIISTRSASTPRMS